MKKSFIIEYGKGQTNYATKRIHECVDYWNREGKDIYQKNKDKELGSAKTQALALSMEYDDFVLNMILIDCNTSYEMFTPSKLNNGVEMGRTRSHVWVHENDERIMMIYFGESK